MTFKKYFKNLYIDLYIKNEKEIIQPKFDDFYQSYIDFIKLGEKIYNDNKKYIKKINCNLNSMDDYNETILCLNESTIDKYYNDKQFEKILNFLNTTSKRTALELAFIAYLIDDTAATCFSNNLEIKTYADENKLFSLVINSEFLLKKLKRFLNLEFDLENKLNNVLQETQLLINNNKESFIKINKKYENFKLNCIELLINYVNKIQAIYIDELKQYTKLHFQNNYDDGFIDVCNFKIIFDNYIGLIFHMLQVYISYKSYIRVGYTSFAERCKICNGFAVLKNNGLCYMCDENKEKTRNKANKECNKLRTEIEKLYENYKFSNEINNRKKYFIDLKEHKYYDYDDLIKLLDDMKKELSKQ